MGTYCVYNKTITTHKRDHMPRESTVQKYAKKKKKRETLTGKNEEISGRKAQINQERMEASLKRREESDIYPTHVCRHRWSRQITMKMDETGAFNQYWLSSTTVMAESSSFTHFHCDLSGLAMSKDTSQVGVALLPSF